MSIAPALFRLVERAVVALEGIERHLREAGKRGKDTSACDGVRRVQVEQRGLGWEPKVVGDCPLYEPGEHTEFCKSRNGVTFCRGYSGSESTMCPPHIELQWVMCSEKKRGDS